MGVMEPVKPATGVITPHPVTLEGQVVGLELRKGETLGQFLARAVPEGFDDGWEVRINGRIVPHELMPHVRPKDGTVIEVRGIVKRNALYIVAFAVLTYFTMGAGATWAAGWGLGAAATTAVYAAAFVAGSLLINKVLGPKPPEARTEERENVYNIGAARNRVRAYEPLALLFGTVRMAPDVISMPYMWYQGDDQYLGMVLTPGVNVHSVEPLDNGDTPLSTYEGVQVYHAGFPGMAEQKIPLYSDADTIEGGELDKSAAWVTRTTPAGTVRIQINLEYILGDVTSKGKPYTNTETVQAEYSPAGANTWAPLVSRTFANDDYNPKRATLMANVPEGQYDVRVRRLGNAFEEKNGRAQFQWTTMTAVQADAADYAGIPRIGVMMKATGQLNGAPDELRCVATSHPCPVWDGTDWNIEHTSNPGAHILHYARGIEDENDVLVAGMGLPDSMIDIEALQAFMLHCEANGYTYDYVIRQARSHAEVLDAIALAGFGQITWAGGRLSVVWAADEQPLSGVVNMATIKKGQFQVDYTLANAADGIEATYYSADDWSTKTLRVPAPGVTTMLRPAQVQLEGVTSEEHAAKLARWHLAQSLYQYKDITYSTDIEHLSYRRLSVLALQHDLTQWGFGGRLVAASENGGLTLKLDEPVPPLATRYVGIRVPGERVYRVFQVQAFSEPTDELHLVGTWPADAAFPGDAPDNPAHDYLWCYDFKATPGLRARVVAIEPESDLKGARVAVVPESPEFWTYVETGAYIPPAPVSSLRTRPIASDLEITERRVVQGDTVFTELVATFAIDGPLSHSVVLMSDANGDLHEVAQTATRTASWRVGGPGVYTIVVRPFSPEGRAGIAVQTVYATEGVAMPPVLVDLFDVVDRSGGVRQYTWGWLSETTQSPDFAGVEIRYIAGTDPAPDWEAMTPVGEDGFFTAPFEHTLPEDGTWTFACRSRNTAGELSTGMRVITRTIGANLGQIIGGIDQELIDKQAAIDQEIADRIAGDLQTAADAAADATAKANAALAQAQAAVDALAAEVGEIVNAPEWDPAEEYLAGWLVRYDGHLYRAIVDTQGDQPDTSPDEWELIGEYASLGEAVAAALTLATQTATELEAEVTRINALYARMPAGTDGLATEAMVLAEAQALATQIGAEASRIDALVARMPGGSGTLATAASVSDEATARANADSALSNRVGVVEARMPSGSDELATSASVTAVDNASVSRDNALGIRVTAVETRMPSGSGELATASALSSLSGTVSNQGGQISANAAAITSVGTQVGGLQASVTEIAEVVATGGSVQVLNPGFESDSGWSASTAVGPLPSLVYYTTTRPRSGARALRFDTSSTVFNLGRTTTKTGEQFFLRAGIRAAPTTPNAGAQISVGVRWYNAVGGYMRGQNQSATAVANGSNFAYGSIDPRTVVTAPEGAVSAQVYLVVSGLTTGGVIYDDIALERLSETEASARARHTVALDVNGHVSGTVSENDGETSSFSILATVFRVISGPTAGIEWQNGYLRAYALGAQIVLGSNFGSGSDLMLWCGPNVGANNCTKANGLFWVDNTGDGYFAGRVLQGVLRWFESTTSTASNASVTTGSNPRLGKVVSLAVRYNFGELYVYTGTNPTVTPGTGSTQATIVIERRYGSGSWTNLTTEAVPGESRAWHGGSGDPAQWSSNISGQVFATDTASNNDSEYRARITSRSVQSHSGTGTPQPVSRTQYLSIEAME